MEQAVLIGKIKTALRTTTTAEDLIDQLEDLASAAIADLGLAGVDGENVSTDDPLVLQAVITYCRLHFGSPEDFDKLQKSYDAQKGQLWSATGYTVWRRGD